MNRALLDQLLAIRQGDSNRRSRLLTAGRLYGGYAEEMQQVHREHAGQLAYLTDRIRFNEERPHRYGLVLDGDADAQLTCAVEDPAQLDARRAAVGLPPFAEDLVQQRQALAAEGGRCPVAGSLPPRKAVEWCHACRTPISPSAIEPADQLLVDATYVEHLASYPAALHRHAGAGHGLPAEQCV